MEESKAFLDSRDPPVRFWAYAFFRQSNVICPSNSGILEVYLS